MFKGKVKSDRLLLIGFFSIMAMVNIVFLTGFYKNGRLEGVTTDIDKKPEVSYQNIMNGKFQSDYSNWFNLNFPFRDKFVRGYNQFYYDIMGEAGNKSIVMGSNSNLYESAQIERRLNPTKAEYGMDYYDSYAKNLKFVQDKFSDMGKGLFFIITPNKPEIFPEDIPLRHKLMADIDYQKFTSHVYLKSALENHGVYFFDSTDTMLRLKNENPDITLYPKTGTHWTYLAALYCVQDAFDKWFRQTGIAFPKTDAEVIENKEPYYGTDIDMSQLLNVFHSEKDKIYYQLNIKRDIPADYIKENAVIFGTSYSEQISYIFQSNNSMFNKLTLVNYLLFMFDVDGQGKHLIKTMNNEITDEELLEIIRNNKYFFFEVQSTDLVPTHEQLVEQLYYLVKDSRKFENFTVQEDKPDNEREGGAFYLGDETSDIEIDVTDKQLVVEKGTKEITVAAKLTNNTGKRITTGGKYLICLAYHIKEGDIVKEGRWSSLPEVIEPAQTIDVLYTLDVPEEAGTYEVNLSLVQEKIAWLEDVNKNYPINLKLIVR